MTKKYVVVKDSEGYFCHAMTYDFFIMNRSWSLDDDEGETFETFTWSGAIDTDEAFARWRDHAMSLCTPERR